MNLAEIKAAIPQSPLRDAPDLPYPLVASGKVRDIFDLGDHYLIVASDRISAYDVVLPGGIPGKGILLTQLSLWWFEQTRDIIPNHLAEDHAAAIAGRLADNPELQTRSMLVRKLRPLRLEAVVRGYLAGSAWKVYQNTGKLWDYHLPDDLRQSDALPEPIFTPTTKAELGEKDLPVTADQARELVGHERFEALRAVALNLYRIGAERARKAGLILADTKFEFGTDNEGRLYLIDEILTPDSSRYWPLDGYAPGQSQEAFDKQFVRDYLESLDWDKTDPGPELPPEIILKTQTKYIQALAHLMQHE